MYTGNVKKKQSSYWFWFRFMYWYSFPILLLLLPPPTSSHIDTQTESISRWTGHSTQILAENPTTLARFLRTPVIIFGIYSWALNLSTFSKHNPVPSPFPFFFFCFFVSGFFLLLLLLVVIYLFIFILLLPSHIVQSLRLAGIGAVAVPVDFQSTW